MEEEVREPVWVDLVGETAHVRLARPAVRNALTVEMLEGLRDAIHTVEESPARAVVLRAEGPAFCSGMDLRERDPARMERALSLLVDVMRRILTSPLPFIARVHGPVRAGGMGLVCAADFIVAADDIDVEFPEARLGLAPTVVSLTVLPRLGPADARRLFLLGQRASAPQARAMGILDETVDKGELDVAVERYVRELTLATSEGLDHSKALLNAATVADLDRRGDELVQTSSAMFIARMARAGVSR